MMGPNMCFALLQHDRARQSERQAGADTAGFADLEDEVDNHWGAQLEAALLSTLLGVGSQLGTRHWHRHKCRSHHGASSRHQRQHESDWTESRSAQSQHPADIDDQTGVSGRVIVNRDLVLEPYKS
jgi:type IV secretion system protein TrbI